MDRDKTALSEFPFTNDQSISREVSYAQLQGLRHSQAGHGEEREQCAIRLRSQRPGGTETGSPVTSCRTSPSEKM